MRTHTRRTPEEVLAQDIKGMDDSKALVEQLLNDEVTGENDLQTIHRNYRHLEILLVRENIIASDLDAAPYQAVIDAATDYLTSLNFEP